MVALSTTRAAPRTTGALLALALHAGAAYALLSYEPARSAVFAAAPLMVELISAAPAQPAPEPRAVRPQPKQRSRIRSKPVETPEPKPQESSPILAAAREERDPLAAAAPSQPAVPDTPAPAPPASVAVTLPQFNAGYLKNPAPAYPPVSRRLGEEGRVILRVRVSPEGSADEVLVRDSSGHARLDEAAREAVRRWKFVPARRGDEPVAAWVVIPISFRLEG